MKCDQDSSGLFLVHKECIGLLSLFMKTIQVVAVHRVSSAFITEKAFKSEWGLVTRFLASSNPEHVHIHTATHWFILYPLSFISLPQALHHSYLSQIFSLFSRSLHRSTWLRSSYRLLIMVCTWCAVFPPNTAATFFGRHQSVGVSFHGD